MRTKSVTRPFILFSAFILTTINISCSKSNSTATPQYYMKFKENGNQVEYTVGVQAAFSNAGNIYECILNGYDVTGSMNIVLTDTSTIIANRNYTQDVVPGLANAYALLIYQAPDGTSYDSQIPQANPDASAQVVITAITSTDVKGTFAGKVTKNNTTLTITEGEFDLKKAP